MFLLSTIVTLIIFMNMIIAQMGDTFDECLGKRDKIVYQSRVQLIHEFLYVSESKILENDENAYLFVVEKI